MLNGPMSTAVSEELFAPLSTGVEVCYQSFGDPDGTPLLLVMGLGGPMNWWDPELCTLLASRGFQVVRFDNRDTGRSSRVDRPVHRRQLVPAVLGRGQRPPYTLSDMGADAVALMDHLGWDSAHVVGASMGGMIVQTMAIDSPARVRSLVSIMSTTGRRLVGWQSPRLFPNLLARRVDGREEYCEASVEMWRRLESPAWPQTDEQIRNRAGETYDRGISGQGTLRQMLAILGQPDRTARLREIRVPSAIIHGTADPMVHVSGGRATAASIPGSELVLIDGMAHDLPRPLYPAFTDVIVRTAERAAR